MSLTSPVSILLSLGTNLGDRRANMVAMERALSKIVIGPLLCSPLMETAPLGVDSSHESYLNRIVAGVTTLSPLEFLKECESIERQLGRTGKGLLSPRTADIDLLLYGDLIVDHPTLTIPHPALLDRRFCIEGVATLFPARLHPISRKRFDTLATEMSPLIRSQPIMMIQETAP